MQGLRELYWNDKSTDKRLFGTLYPNANGEVFFPVKTIFCNDPQGNYVTFRLDGGMDTSFVLNQLSNLNYTSKFGKIQATSSLFTLMYVHEMIDETGRVFQNQNAMDNWKLLKLPWGIIRSCISYIQANVDSTFKITDKQRVLSEITPLMAWRDVEVVRWHNIPFDNGRYEVMLTPTVNVVNPEEFKVPPPPGTVEDFMNNMRAVSSVVNVAQAGAPAASPPATAYPRTRSY